MQGVEGFLCLLKGPLERSLEVEARDTQPLRTVPFVGKAAAGQCRAAEERPVERIEDLIRSRGSFANFELHLPGSEQVVGLMHAKLRVVFPVLPYIDNKAKS